jgi:thymidylate synthase (FAD)
MKSPKLVAVTKPIEQMTAEEFIAYQARVTSPQNQDNHDTAFKLLKYCLINGHWSVFSMVDMTLEIHTSRAIMAQILRHYSFDFQEFSQRYAPVGKDGGLMDWSHLEARSKASTNRQGSGERLQEETDGLIRNAVACEAKYYDLLKDGVAPECARMALPLGVETRAYMKGSVRSWITYFWQRLDLHAQKEHRLLAQEMFEIFKGVFPNIAKIVEDGKSMYLTYEEIETIKALRENKAGVIPITKSTL